MKQTALQPTLIVGAHGSVGMGIYTYLCYRHPSAKFYLTSTAHDLSNYPRSSADTEWLTLDVEKEADIAEVIGTVDLSSSHKYNIVYCAGRICDKPLVNLEVEEWEGVMAVNSRGPFMIVKKAFQGLAVGGKGRLVFIGSVAAQRPRIGQSAYSSSKAALEAFVKVVALELGQFGIPCNLVTPGAISSGMLADASEGLLDNIKKRTPMGRLSTSDDVASVVEFLLTSGSSNITGQSFVVDGGYLLS